MLESELILFESLFHISFKFPTPSQVRSCLSVCGIGFKYFFQIRQAIVRLTQLNIDTANARLCSAGIGIDLQLLLADFEGFFKLRARKIVIG